MNESLLCLLQNVEYMALVTMVADVSGLCPAEVSDGNIEEFLQKLEEGAPRLPVMN